MFKSGQIGAVLFSTLMCLLSSSRALALTETWTTAQSSWPAAWQSVPTTVPLSSGPAVDAFSSENRGLFSGVYNNSVEVWPTSNDNSFTSSEQTARVAVTKTASLIGFVARNGSPERFGLLVGAGDNLTLFRKTASIPYQPLASTPARPLVSTPGNVHWYWLRLRVEYAPVIPSPPNNYVGVTTLTATLWTDSSNGNPAHLGPNGDTQLGTVSASVNHATIPAAGMNGFLLRAGGSVASPGGGWVDDYSAVSLDCVRKWSEASAWADGVVPNSDTVDAKVRALPGCPNGTTIVLDQDATVRSVTVDDGATLEFESSVSRKLSSAGSVVVLGTLKMHPANQSVVQVLELSGANEDDFRGGGMGPYDVYPDDPQMAMPGMMMPACVEGEPDAGYHYYKDSDVGLWVACGGKLDLVGTPRNGWVRTTSSIPAFATSISVGVPTGPKGAGWYQNDELWVAPTQLTNHIFAPYQQFERYNVTATPAPASGTMTLGVSRHSVLDDCAPNGACYFPGMTCSAGKCRCQANCGGANSAGACNTTSGVCSFPHPNDPMSNCGASPDSPICSTAAEILNVTRNVIIKGMPPRDSLPMTFPNQQNRDGHGRAHVFITNTTLREHVIRNVAIQYMGPRRAVPNATPLGRHSTSMTGRYGLHFHHCTSHMDESGEMLPACDSDADCLGSSSSGAPTHCQEGVGQCYADYCAGTEVSGTVVMDTGAHAFVPHHSDRITFVDDIAFRNFDAAYWWDTNAELAVDPIHPTAEDDENATTNRVEWIHCLAAETQADPWNAPEVPGFLLGLGEGNSVRDSVAIAGEGSATASGFEWPATANGIGTFSDNVWQFEHNVAHHNFALGIYLWENDLRHHVIDHFVAYRNETNGVTHGAYSNTFIFQNVSLFQNGGSNYSGNGTGFNNLAQVFLKAQSRSDGENRCLGPTFPATCSGIVDLVPNGQDFARWTNVKLDAGLRTQHVLHIGGDTRTLMDQSTLLKDWTIKNWNDTTHSGAGAAIILYLPAKGQVKLDPDQDSSPVLLNGFARAVDFVNWQVQEDTLRYLDERDFSNGACENGVCQVGAVDLCGPAGALRACGEVKQCAQPPCPPNAVTWVEEPPVLTVPSRFRVQQGYGTNACAFTVAWDVSTQAFVRAGKHLGEDGCEHVSDGSSPRVQFYTANDDTGYRGASQCRDAWGQITSPCSDGT